MSLAYRVLFTGSFDFYPSLFQKLCISIVCCVLAVVSLAVGSWWLAVGSWFPPGQQVPGMFSL